MQDGNARRKKIVQMLQEATEPIRGMELSRKLNVTRQVIVADVALLRAEGAQIVATPRGYLHLKAEASLPCVRTIASRHTAGDDIRTELLAVVNLGGTILDVTVEHPLYGELTGTLQISTAAAVHQFADSLQRSTAEPLLVLTQGYHLHRIAAPTHEQLRAIETKLRQLGFLVPLDQ